MLDAYVGRSATDRAHFKSPPHFVFIESNKRFARHLKMEVEAYATVHGATVDVIHGKHEDEFPRIVDHLSSVYRQPVPTFAFVDPRGYADRSGGGGCVRLARALARAAHAAGTRALPRMCGKAGIGRPGLNGKWSTSSISKPAALIAASVSRLM